MCAAHLTIVHLPFASASSFGLKWSRVSIAFRFVEVMAPKSISGELLDCWRWLNASVRAYIALTTAAFGGLHIK